MSCSGGWSRPLFHAGSQMRLQGQLPLRRSVSQLRSRRCVRVPSRWLRLILRRPQGLPLQIWIQVFVTLGAPYREAQILVRNENFVSGFTQGFVTGLLKWSWAQTRSRFVRFSPDFNTSGAVDLGFISANARNEGVRNGHLHASLLSDATKKKILSHLRSLSPTTHAGNWDRNAQISYVIELAAAGRRTNLFK